MRNKKVDNVNRDAVSLACAEDWTAYVGDTYYGQGDEDHGEEVATVAQLGSGNLREQEVRREDRPREDPDMQKTAASKSVYVGRMEGERRRT